MTTSRKLSEQIIDGLRVRYDLPEAQALTRLILEAVCRIELADVVVNKTLHLDAEKEDDIRDIIRRLLNDEPIQHILGFTWFRDRKFKVDRHVLIPRQETEELVELIVKENPEPGLRLLDIGTGSGCIAISLSIEMKTPEVHACDVNAETLEVARLNAQTNKADVNYFCTDILQQFPPVRDLDLIISNPPYVMESEKSGMDRNVLDFEPGEALFVPDDDPLVFYRKITEWSKINLKKGGKLYFEINESLGSEIEDMLRSFQFIDIVITPDINGKERFARACRD